MTCEILEGDCLEVMKTFPDNHFGCIVTDPPYGLFFMGKGWDHEVPQLACWNECFRVTKPGGFLIAFGGTRTFHKLVNAIEQAGFEIRDAISWIYGSGFPKSLNNFGIQGYGTALKPAQELCTLAMKPLDGTFAQNAEKWGQAGINIDGCRIPTQDNLNGGGYGGNSSIDKNSFGYGFKPGMAGEFNQPNGRWPANIMFDDESSRLLDQQSGIEASRFFYCPKTSSRERNYGLEKLPTRQATGGGGRNNTEDDVCGKYGSIKAPSKNHHPTVKPLKLMEYLIKLVMPPQNGLLLDPFAGSGSTILAAKRLGFDAIGIEKQPEYAEIARARVNNYKKEPEKQHDLFEAM